jgi:excisionase family DNA binding protein
VNGNGVVHRDGGVGGVSDGGTRLREGDLLTVAQVLGILPVGRSTLYALAASGDLPSVRVGAAGSRRGRLLFWRADIEAYVERSRQGARRAPVGADADAVLARVRGRKGGLTQCPARNSSGFQREVTPPCPP